MKAHRYIREDGKSEIWTGIKNNTPITNDMFHNVNLSLPDDFQKALHTTKGESITILDRTSS